MNPEASAADSTNRGPSEDSGRRQKGEGGGFSTPLPHPVNTGAKPAGSRNLAAIIFHELGCVCVTFRKASARSADFFRCFY